MTPKVLTMCLITLGMWGTYMLFGNKASETHGEKVNMALEAGMMMLVAIAAFVVNGGGVLQSFSKVTSASLAYGLLMAFMSAGGIYLQFTAMRMAPNQVSLIALITGMWPVLTVLLAGMLKIGEPLSPKQWVGVLLSGAGLFLASSK